MEERRSRRASLRIPVRLASHCTLADGTSFEAKVINLSTEGILIESSEPIKVGGRLEVEFLLPGSLNSMRLAGELLWSRVSRKIENSEDALNFAGIRFTDHDEIHRSLILDYTIRKLDNHDLLRDGGILMVLEDLRSLSPRDRLKAYHVLIGREDCRL